jgi:hypothetical protein
MTHIAPISPNAALVLVIKEIKPNADKQSVNAEILATSGNPADL